MGTINIAGRQYELNRAHAEKEPLVETFLKDSSDAIMMTCGWHLVTTIQKGLDGVAQFYSKAFSQETLSRLTHTVINFEICANVLIIPKIWTDSGRNWINTIVKLYYRENIDYLEHQKFSGRMVYKFLYDSAKLVVDISRISWIIGPMTATPFMTVIDSARKTWDIQNSIFILCNLANSKDKAVQTYVREKRIFLMFDIASRILNISLVVFSVVTFMHGGFVLSAFSTWAIGFGDVATEFISLVYEKSITDLRQPRGQVGEQSGAVVGDHV